MQKWQEVRKWRRKKRVFLKKPSLGDWNQRENQKPLELNKGIHQSECATWPWHVQCLHYALNATRTESQGSRLNKKPSIFLWSSLHVRTTTKLGGGGAADRPNKCHYPDEPIKYHRLPRPNMDNGRRAIMRNIQYLRWLRISQEDR